jgi:hypothetical protein
MLTFDQTREALQGWLGQQVGVSARRADTPLVEFLNVAGVLHSVERADPTWVQHAGAIEAFNFVVNQPEPSRGVRSWFVLSRAHYAGAELRSSVWNKPELMIDMAGMHLRVGLQITPAEMAALSAAMGS